MIVGYLTQKLNSKLKIVFVTAVVASLGLCQIAAADSYKLNPGDQVEISVWNEENLQKIITVLPDGMISFPLVGHLQAAGKSASEIETTIAAKLDAYIADPEVNVTVTSTRGNVIFVVGKVLKPGPIVMIQSTTVMQALAMAGGLNEFASANSIKIIRRSGIEDGAQETLLKIRYSDLEKGGASCLTANNGQEAIEIASELHVDAILMDIHMPIVDGVTACETIIQQSGESPPIIGLTADVTMVEQQRITKAGAAMLLLKPVNESELIKSLTRVVASSTVASVPRGSGLLSTVVPVEELKKALYESLDKLDKQLRNNEQGSVREIVHDLMGLSGLYGMTELRDMVLAFRANYSSLDAETNLMRVKQIRQHVTNFFAS